MPLFGPNIRKMKDKGDIQGLIKELKNKDPTIRFEVVEALRDLKHVEGLSEALKNDMVGVRVEAAEALKTISDPKAIDVLTKYLTNLLRFGERNDQTEAILIIQAHAPEHFLPMNVDPKRVRIRLSLEPFRDPLLEVIKQPKSAESVWYALVALTELGDRSDEVLSELIEFTNTWVKKLDTEGIEGVLTWALAKSINEETLRTLSHFKGNRVAVDAVTDALEGRLFGSYISKDRSNEAILRIMGDPSTRRTAENMARHGDKDARRVLEFCERATFNEVKAKSALYALGALGDPSTRELLEFWASRGGKSQDIQKSAKVALELFGRGTYDEIKARAEEK